MAKPEAPDHEIHQNQKARMQRRVAITVASVAMVYFLFVFPQSLLDTLQAAINARWSVWVKLAVGVAINGAFAYFLTFILFSADSAVKGSNWVARWVRSQFAANAAKEKYGCSSADAAALWFRYYDTWALPGSPNQHLMYSTYSATYSARAVFYTQIALLVFLLVTGASMFAHWKVFDTYAATGGEMQLAIHALTVVVFVGVFVFLSISNRIPTSNRIATGCWARVQDVFERSRTLFVNDVLQYAPTFQVGFDRVAALRAGYEGKAIAAK